MMKPNLQDMLNVFTIAKQTGEKIMKVYQKDFSVEYKEDQNPLIEADLASHLLVCEEVSKSYPNIPIFSEESVDSFKFTDEND